LYMEKKVVGSGEFWSGSQVMQKWNIIKSLQ
jgi:hypothetical protein